MSGSSGRVDRLAEQLAGWPRKRVPLPDLWRLFDEVDPATRGSTRRRQLLADCLTELGTAGVIEFPAAASFDRTQRPPLPQFVTIPAIDPSRGPVRSTVWHPDLSWAATLRVTGAQAELLEQVNAWLFRGAGADQPPVPLRERSLELLGAEKALDALVGTSLFGPGRLTLGLLRTYRVTVPLHVTSVSAGDVLLVVENSDTFDSLRRALTEEPGRVGTLAWGAGAGFESSVLSVASVEPAVREICYFGDLDAAGLRIPAAASRLAEQEGLPAVQPATALYTALLAVGRPRGGQLPLDTQRADELVGWLDPQHRQPCQLLLTEGNRIAQEAVGLAYLTTTSDWRNL
ncbi:MAG TPA: Wadjet anti-phage system protein JetD domain-containing protein [Pseudonocardiaceae bacterium]|nr:Wadjet anti-phage system protein JetD domain-containing protein [Pseudonocardiaceae bacterium]